MTTLFSWWYTKLYKWIIERTNTIIPVFLVISRSLDRISIHGEPIYWQMLEQKIIVAMLVFMREEGNFICLIYYYFTRWVIQLYNWIITSCRVPNWKHEAYFLLIKHLISECYSCWIWTSSGQTQSVANGQWRFPRLFLSKLWTHSPNCKVLKLHFYYYWKLLIFILKKRL